MSQKKRIAIIPGDGIGPEVIAQAVNVIRASGAAVEMTHFDWSANRYLADGVTVPPDGFAMLERDFDAILLGAFGDPRVASNIHAREILLGMRFRMDLYANVRPVRLLDASLCPLKGIEPKDIDFVVVRENTEGVYVDAGGVFKQGTPDEVAVQEDINTRKGVERVIRYSFEYCERHKKQDGISPQACADVRQIQRHDLCGRVVAARVQGSGPRVSPDHIAAHVRGRALHPDGARPAAVRRNRNQQHVRRHHHRPGGWPYRAGWAWPPAEIFIPENVDVRAGARFGSAACGKEHGESAGAILTAAMMLAHLGLTAEAGKIEAAVLEAVRQKKTTQDIGGSLGTREAGEWVARKVHSG